MRWVISERLMKYILDDGDELELREDAPEDVKEEFEEFVTALKISAGPTPPVSLQKWLRWDRNKRALVLKEDAPEDVVKRFEKWRKFMDSLE